MGSVGGSDGSGIGRPPYVAHRRSSRPRVIAVGLGFEPTVTTRSHSHHRRAPLGAPGEGGAGQRTHRLSQTTGFLPRLRSVWIDRSDALASRSGVGEEKSQWRRRRSRERRGRKRGHVEQPRTVTKMAEPSHGLSLSLFLCLFFFFSNSSWAYSDIVGCTINFISYDISIVESKRSKNFIPQG